MRSLVILLVLGAMIAFSRPAPVFAGPNANAKILIHLAAPTAKNPCTRAEAAPPCSEIVTSGDLYPSTYFAYVLVTDADSAAGVAGIQFGISFDNTPAVGVDVLSWTNCATLEFPMTGWPAAGTGNLITWDRTTQCQRFEPGGSGTGVVAVAGYFYCAAYTPDTLLVIPRPVDALAKVGTCDPVFEDTLGTIALGSASFSAGAVVPGYGPCGTGGSNGDGSGTDDGRSGQDLPGELFSSGFDPTWVIVTFPFSLTLARDQGIVLCDQVFLEGETVVFDYDESLQELTLNGVKWASYAPPKPRARGPIGIWVDKFLTAYESLHQGTNRERAIQALKLAGPGILDSTYTPTVTDDYVSVRLAGSSGDFFIPLNSPIPPQTTQPADRARDMASLYSKWFTDPSKKVVIIRQCGGGEFGCFGENASAALNLISLVRRGLTLTPEQTALSRRFHLTSYFASIGGIK